MSETELKIIQYFFLLKKIVLIIMIIIFIFTFTLKFGRHFSRIFFSFRVCVFTFEDIEFL